MIGPSYPAAQAVAPKVRLHFASHLAAERKRGQTNLALEPDSAVIETIIDAAFWASLRREETYAPKISLAYLTPEQAEHPLLLEQPLPLNAESLARLAPAVERPGIHLGVCQVGSDLAVWGATRNLPSICFVIEVVAPGLLVIKHRVSEEAGKFVNVAVLEGDQIKILNNQPMDMPDSPPVVKSLLGLNSPVAGIDSLNVLLHLAVSMRQHGRGGSLLVVPADAQNWRESIVQPSPYAVSPIYSELAHLMGRNRGKRNGRPHQEAIRRVIDTVAGLTAVDGATILTDQFELIAFGVKIGRRDGAIRVEQVVESEPIEGAVVRILHPTQLGGTRHLSAAQFAQDQRDSVALVASQDGRFTVFAWSASRDMVYAYRVEALLL
jgi:hypothetical protein